MSQHICNPYVGEPKGWRYTALAIVLLAVTASFVFGWYFDRSKPIGGSGWADQTLYTKASNRIAHAELPTPGQLHFAIGYPLLGAIGHVVSNSDPFMIVSLGLLLGSVLFCFLAAERIFDFIWATGFCLLLFYWDFVGRTFNFSSELFVIPWNNQVLFFAMAFYFWLFTNKTKEASWGLLTTAGIISGFCILTREETALFMLPMLLAYLYLTKANLRQCIFAFALLCVCYIPQLLVKSVVFGSVTAQSGRFGDSYLYILSRNFNFKFLYKNIWSTIIDSTHYLGTLLLTQPPRREALLQAAPWLWVAPVGIGGMLILKRVPVGVKFFLVASSGVILFYLCGPHMSAEKLKYHCLRYIAPGFIALNLGTIFVLRYVVAHGVVPLIKSTKNNVFRDPSGAQ